MDDDIQVNMITRDLPDGHRWRSMGYEALDALEYREEGDVNGYRAVVITRPAGTWTVGDLADAIERIREIVRNRPPLEDPCSQD